MQNKKAFRLNYIKNKIEKDFPSKHQKKEDEKYTREIVKRNVINLPKFHDPIRIHRTVGDLIFLDRIYDQEEFVGISSLRNNFKKIIEIKVSKNFILASLEDYHDSPPSNISFIVQRLKSLGLKDSFELGCTIEILEQAFKTMSIQSPIPITLAPSLSSSSLDFLLSSHQSDPLIMKHYNPNPQFGMRLAKMGMNKLMRQLTFGDDIRIFEDSVMLTPVSTYWQYTSDKLRMFKTIEEDSLFEIYLNTFEGPKIGLAKLYNVALGEEKIALIAFPFNKQTEVLKSMIKRVGKELREEEEEEKREEQVREEGRRREGEMDEEIGKGREGKGRKEEEGGEEEEWENENRKEKRGGKRTKNLEEWEKLLKLYFYRYRKIRKVKVEEK